MSTTRAVHGNHTYQRKPPRGATAGSFVDGSGNSAGLRSTDAETWAGSIAPGAEFGTTGSFAATMRSGAGSGSGRFIAFGSAITCTTTVTGPCTEGDGCREGTSGSSS